MLIGLNKIHEDKICLTFKRNYRAGLDLMLYFFRNLPGRGVRYSSKKKPELVCKVLYVITVDIASKNLSITFVYFLTGLLFYLRSTKIHETDEKGFLQKRAKISLVFCLSYQWQL